MVVELEERVERLENRFSRIETSAAVAGAHDKNVEKRLSAIEETLKWLVRLIIGALIIAILGFVVNGGIPRI